MANDMVLRPSNFGELLTFAEMAASSGMVPKDYVNKPQAIMVAIQMGSELGLAPMQSLQNIAVINGRPSVWGDAMLALCKASPKCAGVHEYLEGDGDAMKAVCEALRFDQAPTKAEFSVADAKKAGLWGKTGPWTQYPKRMLAMRARGFALRDAFPDILRGLVSSEEAQDIPRDTFAGSTIDAAPTQTFEDRVDEALSQPNGTAWLKSLGALLEDAGSLTDIGVIEAHPSVTKAKKFAPSTIRAAIIDMFKEAVARFEPKAGGGSEIQFGEPPEETPVSKITAEMKEMETDDQIKEWSMTTTTKDYMAALRSSDPKAFSDVLRIIDERRLELEGR